MNSTSFIKKYLDYRRNFLRDTLGAGGGVIKQAEISCKTCEGERLICSDICSIFFRIDTNQVFLAPQPCHFSEFEIYLLDANQRAEWISFYTELKVQTRWF